MNETMRAVEFAVTHASVPVVSSKITGMARFGLLEAIQRGDVLTTEEEEEYKEEVKG